MKLSNIKALGRYKNESTGQEVNLKVGRNNQRGIEILFYIKSGERVFISDRDFYSLKIWKKVVDA